MKRSGEYSLAVCFPVWNRPDLFKTCFESLLRQLGGIEASIWIFDNGSDEPTRRLIEGLTSTEHRLFKIFLPVNMGIPYVANVFSQMLTQDCEFVGYRAARHLMIADADAYFKKPIRQMIEVLESNNHFAIISGHDSVEHKTLAAYEHALDGATIPVKVKGIERGLCLVMRKEILAACVPLPHHRSHDIDWELMKWHPNSISGRMRQLVAVDHVAHLGLYESTWHPVGVPATREEVAEINQIMKQEGLFTPIRRARMEEFCRHFKLEPA